MRTTRRLLTITLICALVSAVLMMTVVSGIVAQDATSETPAAETETTEPEATTATETETTEPEATTPAETEPTTKAEPESVVEEEAATLPGITILIFGIGVAVVMGTGIALVLRENNERRAGKTPSL